MQHGQKAIEQAVSNFEMFSDVLQTETSQAANKARADVDIAHDEAYYERIAKTIEYKPETSLEL